MFLSTSQGNLFSCQHLLLFDVLGSINTVSYSKPSTHITDYTYSNLYTNRCKLLPLLNMKIPQTRVKHKRCMVPFTFHYMGEILSQNIYSSMMYGKR